MRGRQAGRRRRAGGHDGACEPRFEIQPLIDSGRLAHFSGKILMRRSASRLVSPANNTAFARAFRPVKIKPGFDFRTASAIIVSSLAFEVGQQTHPDDGLPASPSCPSSPSERRGGRRFVCRHLLFQNHSRACRRCRLGANVSPCRRWNSSQRTKLSPPITTTWRNSPNSASSTKPPSAPRFRNCWNTAPASSIGNSFPNTPSNAKACRNRRRCEQPGHQPGNRPNQTGSN